MNLNQFKEVCDSKIELMHNLSQTKMEVMQSQLQPHFLFNTLNSILALIDVDVNKSKTVIVDLSFLLRKVLNSKFNNLIELQEEITLLNKYINILKIRFSDDLEVEQDIEMNLENVLLPNMLLQIIFENAIKHGYSPKHLRLKVTIKIKRQNDKLLIIVDNTGKAMSETFEESLNKGLGLKNINNRLKIIYKDDFDFIIKNTVNGVRVIVLIPFIIGEYDHKK